MKPHPALFSLSLALFAAVSPVDAQVATPTAHWGGNMLPEPRPRTDVGLHFVGFTRYGKEMRPGTTEYTFTPYNEIDETLGFNFLTHTKSEIVARASSTWSSLSSRRTFMAGVVGDKVTEFLQNDAVHWARIRKDSLERIPRRLTDTREHTPGEPMRWGGPYILGVSQEYMLRLQNTRFRNGEEEAVPTPFFVGAGAALSTLNHEIFLQAGSNVMEVDVRPRSAGNPTPVPLGIPAVVQLTSVGLGGMVRGGVLQPAGYFEDVTSHYTNIQGVARFGLTLFRYDVDLDVAVTGADGFFVRTRTPEQLAVAAELQRDPEDVYEAKTPMRERFVSLRVRAGGFTLETYNDMIGGKDKGPSFGAHVAFEMSGLGWRR